jgi:hypothetical protein
VLNIWDLNPTAFQLCLLIPHYEVQENQEGFELSEKQQLLKDGDVNIME